MKQIVLILLFIFTLQKKIHTDPPRVLHQTRGFSFIILPSQDCPSGFIKRCFVKGKNLNINSLPNLCKCFEKKTEKIKRILQEIRTVKYKTPKGKGTPLKKRLPKDKYNPLRGKLEHVVKNSKKCNGDYYVCYNYPIQKMSRCHCSKHPY